MGIAGSTLIGRGLWMAGLAAQWPHLALRPHASLGPEAHDVNKGGWEGGWSAWEAKGTASGWRLQPDVRAGNRTPENLLAKGPWRAGREASLAACK